MSQYRCSDCGWIYDEMKGDIGRGIPAGTLWEDVPDDFKCANCSNRKKTHHWKKINN